MVESDERFRMGMSRIPCLHISRELMDARTEMN